MADVFPIIIDGNKKRRFDPAKGDELPAGSGGYKDQVQSQTIEVSSSDTSVAVLTLVTPAIVAADYKIDWSSLFTTSNSNRELTLTIEVNSVEIWKMEQATASSAVRDSTSSQRVVPLGVGPHTIEMKFASKDNAASVTVLDRTITMERWE